MTRDSPDLTRNLSNIPPKPSSDIWPEGLGNLRSPLPNRARVAGASLAFGGGQIALAARPDRLLPGGTRGHAPGAGRRRERDLTARLAAAGDRQHEAWALPAQLVALSSARSVPASGDQIAGGHTAPGR